MAQSINEYCSVGVFGKSKDQKTVYGCLISAPILGVGELRSDIEDPSMLVRKTREFLLQIGPADGRINIGQLRTSKPEFVSELQDYDSLRPLEFEWLRDNILGCVLSYQGQKPRISEKRIQLTDEELRSPFNTSLAKKIREELKVKPYELAAQLGISVGSLHLIEKRGPASGSASRKYFSWIREVSGWDIQ